MPKKILVVEDDPVSQQLVRSILEKSGYLVGLAENGQEGIQVASTYKPDLIVMDIMMPIMGGFEACAQIRQDKEIGHTPIILLTALTEIEHKIKGFEAGGDDYIAKPFDSKEFLSRIEALLRRTSYIQTVDQNRDLQGKIIAVFSLRGGAGVSTVSANLASAFPPLWGEEALLVDLNLIAGQSALFMNVSLKHSLADIADVPIEEIDFNFLNEILLGESDGVKVLAAPPRPSEGEKFSGEKISHCLGILRKNFHYTVIDLPHDFSSTTLAALDLADEIVLLTPPEIAGIRSVVIALNTFKHLGYSPEQIRVITNWIFEKQGVPREKIESVIKRDVDLEIPYAGAQMMHALNFGIPVVFEDPNSSLSALFNDFAFALSKAEHNRSIPDNPTEAWKRVAKRIKVRRSKLGKS